jgi:hypothetical protein
MAVALLSVVTGLDIQVATARTGDLSKFTPTPVNRTMKGNRLLLAPELAKQPRQGNSEPKLPEGCATSAKTARSIFLSEVPGRCVASRSSSTAVLG